MKNTSRSLILWLDAVAIKNISKELTPYLWSLKKNKGWSFLEQKSSFGYSSIPASLLTGKTINEHKQFTVYRKKRDNEAISFWQKTAQFMPSKLANYWFNFGRYFLGDDFFLPPINASVTKIVVPAQKKSYPHQNSLPVSSIFDTWRDRGESFLYYNWPLVVTDTKTQLTIGTQSTDLDRTKTFIQFFKNYKPRHSFFHLWDLDSVGHDSGPGTKKFNTTLKRYDELAKKCISLFDQDKDSIIIFSDHGMIPISEVINPQKIIDLFPNANNLNWFADSTILRIWNVEQKSKAVLKSLKIGSVLEAEDLKKLEMNKTSVEYGDLFFVLKPGYAFSPTSFSSDHIPKGMHGYLDKEIKNEDRPLVVFNKSISMLDTTVIAKNVVKTNLILKVAGLL